ncbi:putative reverse transcriptase domain-containing protein [Tanacetum coccineum]|uniref:Reverse transcriptase domain-containing protein n=1 Tax=Tanacetum coccineum TaxID=301880 RepID=A0ABQ4ZAD4_9ASTR
MVRIGAVQKPPSDDEDIERPRKKSKNSTSDGTEGPSEPRGPPIELVFWSCIALDGDMIMPPIAMSEARMREVIKEQVVASMAKFMAHMNRGANGDEAGGARAGGAGAGGARAGSVGAGGARVSGAGLAAPEITGCTYITFMKCDPQPFKGTESAVGLCQWFKKLESMFRISDCKERDKVKFATATLQGRALTWWNGRIASMGIDATNGTPWTDVRKWMTEEFCPRSVLQRLEQELYDLKLKGTDIDWYTNRFHELALLCPIMVEPKHVKVEQYIRGLSKNIRGDVTSSRPASIDEAVRMAYQLMGQIIQDKADEVFEGEKRKGEGDRGGRGDNRRDYNRRQNQRRANAGAMTNAPNDNKVCPKCKNKKHARDCEITMELFTVGAVDARMNPKVITELGSFDVIIGMDWSPRYDAAILCGEKKVRIPLEGKTLNWKEKRLGRCSVIRDFPEGFPQIYLDLPNHPGKFEFLEACKEENIGAEGFRGEGEPFEVRLFVQNVERDAFLMAVFFLNNSYLASIKAAPFEALHGGNVDRLRPKEKDTQAPQSSIPSDPTNIADEAVIEKPKKKGGSRTHKLKRLYKIGRSARVVSSEEASLGDQEDASKQGRKIGDINADVEITLVDETQGRHDDDLMFDTGVLNDEEVFVGQDMAEKEVSTADPVTTAGEVVTTTNVEVSTVSPTAATITNVELTLVQTLAELKSARPKTKWLVMQEPSESIITTKTPITSSKDNGKGIMVEEPFKMKKKDQVLFDEQEAIRLQAQFDEEERIAREKEMPMLP